MRYEDAVKLEELARNAETKRQIAEAHRMRNTPTDPEEAKKSRVEYEIAEAELMAAEGALARAKGQMYCYGHLKD